MVKAEHLIHGNDMIQRRPTLGQVSRAAGDQERPWRHESVEFDQIVSGFHKRFVGPGSWLAFTGEFAPGTCIPSIRNPTQVKAKIPDVPVIDAATRVLLATVAFIKDDTRV